MDRRKFLSSLIGGVAATAAVRTWPFRVFSFPSEIKLRQFGPWVFGQDYYVIHWPVMPREMSHARYDVSILIGMEQVEKALDAYEKAHPFDPTKPLSVHDIPSVARPMFPLMLPSTQNSGENRSPGTHASESQALEKRPVR